MNISARADYAVRAMLALAAAGGDSPVSVVRLAEDQDLATATAAAKRTKHRPWSHPGMPK